MQLNLDEIIDKEVQRYLDTFSGAPLCMDFKELRELVQFGLGMRTSTGVNHWRELKNKPEKSTGKKNIYILSGNGTTSRKAANGLCKTVENMLTPANKKKCNICAVYYDNTAVEEHIVDIRSNVLFKMLLLDEIAKQNEDGIWQKIPVDEAKKNLRGVIINTHCFGGYLAHGMDKLLAKNLEELGYTKQEQKEIARQLFVLHNNNVDIRLGTSSLQSSHLYRMSKSDKKMKKKLGTFLAHSFEDSFLRYLDNEELTDDELLMVPISLNEEALIAKKISNGDEEEHACYWSHKKTKVGQEEEEIANKILNDVVQSSTPILSVKQVVEKSILSSTSNKDRLQEVIEYGQEFAEDYYDYRDEIRKPFSTAKEKIINGILTLSEADNISKTTANLLDDDKCRLLDYAMINGQTGIFKVLLNKTVCPSQEDYLQKAINLNNADCFLLMAQKFDDISLKMVDYDRANDETLRQILPVVVERLNKKENTKILSHLKDKLNKVSKKNDIHPTFASDGR